MRRSIKVSDYEVTYDVARRDVKYPRLEFKTGDLVLILPRHAQNEEDIIKRHIRWIRGKKNFISSALENPKAGKLALQKTDEQFRKLVTDCADKFAAASNGRLNKVFFRKMRSKWASMSAHGNLTLNNLMRYLPSRLVRYVVYHEMTHLKERKHNDAFRRAIERKYKNFRRMEKDLFRYWFLINGKDCRGQKRLHN